MNAEQQRLVDEHSGRAAWKRWGPYLSLREWGTVREDYSAGGNAWEFFPHEHARSRAYRWGEDGLGGICDRWQHVCFALALWNGRDPILKERLFGLTGNEGNHGEDAKEYWFPLDSTPTHSFMRWLYKYPQAEYPYAWLVEENRRRGRNDPEFELADTGVFDQGRYFDVEITYAKATPNDICVRIDCSNRGPDPAPLHVLPTAWFRNTWAWGRDPRHPLMWRYTHEIIEMAHTTLGQFWLAAEGGAELLFTDHETNSQRLFGQPNRTAYTKDGINDHVVHGAPTVDPSGEGTKAAAWYRLEVPAGQAVSLRLRLADREPDDTTFGAEFDEVVEQRRGAAPAVLPRPCALAGAW